MSTETTTQERMLIGQVMLHEGVIRPEALQDGLQHQQRVKEGFIGQILIDLGYISEDILKDCLRKQYLSNFHEAPKLTM